MQNEVNKNKNSIKKQTEIRYKTVYGDFDNVVNKIKEAAVRERVELFFNKIPVLFWDPDGSMREILGPFTTLLVLNTLGNSIIEYSANPYVKLFEIGIEKDGAKKKLRIPGTVGEILYSYLIGNACSVREVIKYFDTKYRSFYINDETYDNLFFIKDEDKAIKEICDDLYGLIASRKIKDLKELREYFTEDTKILFGLVILRIVFEDLDVLYETGKRSDIALKFGIPAWLKDCVFEQFMNCVMKKPGGTFENGEEFMFSYVTIEKDETEKWLEEIIKYTVLRCQIGPIRLAKYFARLEEDKLNLDPDTEEIVGLRYPRFYEDYIKSKECASFYNKDSFGTLFLVLLGRNISSTGCLDYDNHCTYKCFRQFINNLKPTEEMIKLAFLRSFRKIPSWISDACADTGVIFPEAMNFWGKNFFRPIVQAMMNVLDFENMEMLFCAIFYNVHPCEDENVYNDWKNFHEDGLVNINFDPQKMDIIFNSIDELRNDRKLVAITALANRNFRFADKETIKKRFRTQCDKAFNTCIIHTKRRLDIKFYELLFRLVVRRKVIGLSKYQLKCIKEIAETDELNKIEIREDLLKLFDTNELKKELEDTPKSPEKCKNKNIINLKEEDKEDGEKGKKYSKTRDKKTSLRKRIKFAKSLGSKKAHDNKLDKMLGHKRNSDRKPDKEDEK